MLEAVGVRSAFITTPAHIFAAFDSGMDEETASKVLDSSNSALILEGRAWIPVEVTLVKNGFLQAWKTGLSEFRQAGAGAAIYPVEEAWKVYEPVGFATGLVAPPLPSRDQLLTAYRSEMATVAKEQIASRVADLQKKIKAGGPDASDLSNKLGVLYARYALMDNARAQFEASIKAKANAPALINLGNVELGAGNPTKALGYFDRAIKISQESSDALLGRARCLQYGDDKAAFDAAVARLRTKNPSLAEKYFPAGN
jgi:tetratricopeptide (TPR) repeat protein